METLEDRFLRVLLRFLYPPMFLPLPQPVWVVALSEPAIRGLAEESLQSMEAIYAVTVTVVKPSIAILPFHFSRYLILLTNWEHRVKELETGNRISFCPLGFGTSCCDDQSTDYTRVVERSDPPWSIAEGRIRRQVMLDPQQTPWFHRRILKLELKCFKSSFRELPEIGFGD
jgi:hypothetical protein